MDISTFWFVVLLIGTAYSFLGSIEWLDVVGNGSNRPLNAIYEDERGKTRYQANVILPAIRSTAYAFAFIFVPGWAYYGYKELGIHFFSEAVIFLSITSGLIHLYLMLKMFTFVKLKENNDRRAEEIGAKPLLLGLKFVRLYLLIADWSISIYLLMMLVSAFLSF